MQVETKTNCFDFAVYCFQVVFPVVYHDKFYKDVLEAGELAKLAYYNDIVVGAVCCRVDVIEEVCSSFPLVKRKRK